MVRFSNYELIEALHKNSRTSFTELAKRFKVSETAVRKRVKKLESEGVIEGFSLKLNPKKVDFIISIIGVDALPESYFKVIESLKKKREVKSLFTSSGDHMILMECWNSSREKIKTFIRNIENMEGVTKVCPAIILDRVK